MPYRLVPPRPGRTPYWYVRGTHRGTYLERSTGETRREKAERWRRLWIDEADSGRLSGRGVLTFDAAVESYLDAGHVDRFLGPLVDRLGGMPIQDITQAVIDDAAAALYPESGAPTRNRQVYTPVSAVLKHAGLDARITRPKGWLPPPTTLWLEPPQAFRLLTAARAVDPEFGLFLELLLYTGLRLSEALRLEVDRLSLAERYAYAGRTKNGAPRLVHLPPSLVAALANHPRGLDRPGERLFRLTKCGRLYTLLALARKAAGAGCNGVTFHTLRHTWAAWMRRYGGLDTSGLVATDAWKNRASASRYEHVVASDEARRADLLPSPVSGKNPGKRRRSAAKPLKSKAS